MAAMRSAPSVAVFLPLLAAALGASCSRPAPLFVEQNARAHINMLAGTIGSRPAGTPANEKARAYIVDQLTLYGFTVRVQEVDARRAELGRTAHVANIIGVLPGERPEAVGLVTHYDSGFDNPGAADDAFGVAVSLEAARSIASRQGRRWTLFVLVTDAEEAGLMGAAGLATDREIVDRLKAYINLEAVGSSDPVALFEAGPGNGWLVAAWAKHAPHPRGGSYGLEVYRRLPNDTDFSILKRLDIPGLNFASVGDSHPYHTARDVPDRLPPRVVQKAGENVVAVVDALDAIDVTQRAAWDATYFDVGGTVAVSFGPWVAWTIAGAALLLGVIAFVRTAGAVIRIGGVARLLLAAFWAGSALLLAAASMIGVTWALRAARQVYHPWYAYPDRLILLLAITGISVAWAVTRVGTWLPPKAHGPRHPALTWTLTLPVWIALAVTALWLAPGAAYLWTVPLLVAGILLSVTPRSNALAIRVVSVAILGVAATLWLRETVELTRFMVAVFGRLPMVTPVFVYGAVLALAGLMIVPPLLAAVAPPHPVPRPSLMTALCLAAVATAAGFAYAAPAYTYDQPLRRHVRAIQDEGAGGAVWDVGSTEPGLDLEAGAPTGWTIETTAPQVSVPVGRFTLPFVFRTRGPSLGAPPARIGGVTQTAVEAGVELAVTVVPQEPGIVVTFAAPPGVTPARSNLPGVARLGRWRATYFAPRPDGVVWRAAFAGADAAALGGVRVVVTTGRFPGGSGWQQLPAWLPQERTVWTGTAMWVLTPPAGVTPTAESEPLR
jgi:Peptidase family M28